MQHRSGQRTSRILGETAVECLRWPWFLTAVTPLVERMLSSGIAGRTAGQQAAGAKRSCSEPQLALAMNTSGEWGVYRPKDVAYSMCDVDGLRMASYAALKGSISDDSTG